LCRAAERWKTRRGWRCQWREGVGTGGLLKIKRDLLFHRLFAGLLRHPAIERILHCGERGLLKKLGLCRGNALQIRIHIFMNAACQRGGG